LIKMYNTTPGLNKNIFQKKSVTALFFLSLITFGIYTAVWYIKRANEFKNLGTEKKLNKTLAVILLILTCIGLLAFIFMAYYFFSFFMQIFVTAVAGGTPNLQGVETINSMTYISNIVSILTFIFYLILGFSVRGIINEFRHKKKIEIKVNGLLTFFFNFLYLQYEINRTIDGREYQKRIGPWVWLIILFLVPLLFSLIILISGLFLSI